MHACAYVKCEEDDEIKAVFEIRYDYNCSPFKDAIIENNIIGIGYEGFFYMYSLNENKSLLVLPMHGYFGHLYYHENCFYVADAEGLYSIDNTGAIIWHSKSLGIDGVVVYDFTNDTITGQGEWDPPSGWRDFILDKHTGMLLENI